MRYLAWTTATLSALILAAHFLHAGNTLIAGACLLLPVLLLRQRYWLIRLLQAFLLAGAVVWLFTMVDLVNHFREIGRPPLRMMIIMTSVAAFTALSAVLLQVAMTSRRHPRPSPQAGA